MDGERPLLREKSIGQLRSVHAMKRGALRMFDPMLAAVARERELDRMREVSDLLGRMHGAFSARRSETASHAEALELFEHLEIASLGLLVRLPERSGDESTANVARQCLAEDEAMAATINRNWPTCSA